MHLHYCNNKCIFVGFVGWKLLVIVSKLPSVSQNWRLNSRKGGSWNITGRTKGKASGKAWKHPSGNIAWIFLHHTCWQSITKTLLTSNIPQWGRVSLSKCLRSRTKPWGSPIFGGIKGKDFITLEFRWMGRGSEGKSTVTYMKSHLPEESFGYCLWNITH